MLRTPEKSSSESNLEQMSNNPEFSPRVGYVNTRNKRKRSEELVTDFTDFKNEIKGMISSWMSQQKSETAQITSSLKTIEDSLSFLSIQYEDMRKKVEDLEQENHKDRQYILILENKIENLEKSQRKCSFEIKNVPKSKDETKSTLMNMVCHLSSSLKVDLKINDIKDTYRASNKGENKPIIVEMSSYIQKLNLMQAAKKYNIQNKNNKLNSHQLGLKSNTPIFLSEHLTQKGNRLYYLAREMTKTLKFKFCWTSIGEVFVRKDENSAIIKIVSESHIKSIYDSNK